jgi:predicted phosphodiesterase
MCAVASVGLISDTHGLLRPEASVALRGSDLIIHAGDVGKPQIIVHLRSLAPVVAFRGNIDKDAWASHLPLTAVAEAGSVLIGRPDGIDRVLGANVYLAFADCRSRVDVRVEVVDR